MGCWRRGNGPASWFSLTFGSAICRRTGKIGRNAFLERACIYPFAVDSHGNWFAIAFGKCERSANIRWRGQGTLRRQRDD